MRRLPPLNALRAFEAAARLGSFVAAAAELHVTATAVSQQVGRLERYLETRLFTRLPRGLVLTERGRDWLPDLTTGLDLLAHSTTRLRAREAGGTLTLTTLAGFATGWLLPRLQRFRDRAPRVDVIVRTGRNVADFRREDLDLAIRFAPGAAAGLHAIPLVGETLFPVASPSLFRHGVVPDSIAALSSLPLLEDTDAHPHQPWMGWRAWFRRAGLDPATARVAMHSNDAVVLTSAAVAGLGVALGRGPHVEPWLARGQLIRVTSESWRPDWQYFLTAPAAHFRRPAVRAFVDWAAEEAASDTPR